jgi:hypothetical protein
MNVTAVAHTSHLLLMTQDDVLTPCSSHAACNCRLQILIVGELQAVPDKNLVLLAVPFFCLSVPQVRLLMEMLHLEKWRHMPLQLQFTSSASLKYLANCPAMPSGMEVGVASLEVTSLFSCLCHCMHCACWYRGYKLKKAY